jgi:DNA-binding transcriptional ArsR family regulator
MDPSRIPAETGFPAEVAEQLADVMFALSTPSRVQILGCLAGGAHGVSELVAALGLEQSAISHQLRVLRDHSLVRVERHGRRRVYTLYDEHVLALLDEAVRHVEERRGIRPSARGSVAARAAVASQD